MIDPVQGWHPDYEHLMWIDAEPHFGMYIVTSDAVPGSMLADDDMLQSMLGDQYDDACGYVSDEYIPFFEG